MILELKTNKTTYEFEPKREYLFIRDKTHGDFISVPLAELGRFIAKLEEIETEGKV